MCENESLEAIHLKLKYCQWQGAHETPDKMVINNRKQFCVHPKERQRLVRCGNYICDDDSSAVCKYEMTKNEVPSTEEKKTG